MLWGSLFLLLFVSLSLTHAYKPVFFMHGLDGSANDWTSVVGWLQQVHPGQIATALTTDSYGYSHEVMDQQVQDIIAAIKDAIQANPSAYSDGFHLVGHSQGGLLTRAVLMQSGFPIVNYVSCAGPHYGVYGNYSMPGMPNLTPAEITDMVYTPKFQSSESFANYWHDPVNYTRYVSNALWLSTLNNETFNPNSEEWKKNFLSANTTVFNISPADGEIFPWVSSVFGFWNQEVNGYVNMTDQPIFTNDSFGLQTAYKRGSLILNIVPNAVHADWLRKQTLFQNYILPFLS